MSTLCPTGCPLKTLTVLNNHRYTHDLPLLLAHLHHFQCVWSSMFSSLCACSPGPAFHYSEPHKQTADALLECLSCFLIDSEHSAGASGLWLCILCTFTLTTCPSSKSLFPDERTRIQKTHTGSRSLSSSLKVSSPIMDGESFHYAGESLQMPRREKNPSTG